MKACPKCQTKNQESNRICKKCGYEFSNSFQEKKEKVLGEKRAKSFWIPALFILIATGVGGVGYWMLQRDTLANPKLSSQPKIEASVSYVGQKVPMADVQAKVENGKISIPIQTVREKKMVRFEYEGKGGKIPFVAYVAPSGKVVTAVSMCEPCKSTRFHINENKMVCNACYTEWDLENLRGIKGGCLNYPPDVIPSKVEGDQIRIDEQVVSQWKPRV
jgi:uncharacterized Zn ribbon protein